MYRGSRKHILDWTSHRDFLRQVENLIGLPECSVADSPDWQPRGYKEPDEACENNRDVYDFMIFF